LESKDEAERMELQRMVAMFLKKVEFINKSQIELSNQSPPSQADIQVAIGAWDRLMPQMKMLLDNQTELVDKFARLLAGESIPEEDHEKGPRMAFMEKEK
jgi:hypothetical protein